jgi:hypothetical protein
MNSYEKIYTMLIEGASTGGSPAVTGLRVGNFMARRGKGRMFRGIGVPPDTVKTAGDPKGSGKDIRQITSISKRLAVRAAKKGGNPQEVVDNFFTGMKLGAGGENRRRVKGKTSGPFNTKSIKNQPLN